MHKPNCRKRSWHYYGTSGAALEFLEKRPLVAKLWQQHVVDYYSETSKCSYSIKINHIFFHTIIATNCTETTDQTSKNQTTIRCYTYYFIATSHIETDDHASKHCIIDVLILLIVTIATNRVETDDHASKHQVMHALNLLIVTIATSYVETDDHTSKH